MKKGLLAIVASLLLISLPLNAHAAENLTVEIQSESKVVKDDDLKLKLHTNLPKKMKFYATITGANDYEKEIKAKIDKNGDLYKKVKNLDVGKYTMTYKSYKPKKQPKKVKKVIGKNGGYLKGDNIKNGVITFTETLEVKELIKEAPSTDKDASASDIDKETQELAMKIILADNFSKTGTVEFNAKLKAYSVTPTEPEMLLAITQLQSGELDPANWDTIVKSFKNMSESVKKNLGSGYFVELVNPANTENSLLIIQDGVVFYDFMDEYR